MPPTVARLPVTELQALRERGALSIFLGTDDATEVPYFAVDLCENADEERRTEAHAMRPQRPEQRLPGMDLQRQ